MTRLLRIALAQTGGQPASLDEALAVLAEHAATAAKAGGAFLLSPELALSGYGDFAKTQSLAIGLDEASARVGAIAKAHEIGILVGYCEKLEGGYANAALLVAADGRRLLNYRKMHLWGAYEEAIFKPGSPADVVEIGDGIKAGVLICFDLDHPVTTQDLAARDADIVFVLSGTTKPYDIVPLAQVPARAYENAVFIAFCDQAGSQNGFDFVGLSTVAAPDGTVLARAGGSSAELILADLDMAAFESYRRAHRYADKLRRDLYPEPQRLEGLG